LTGFFSGGRVVDVALAFMLIELVALLIVRKCGATMLRPLDVMVNCGAGAALLLALRAALRSSGWHPVALWLVVALGFHLWDLSLRHAARRMK
jgi:uncharacterized membrane-anchored protein